MSFSRPLLAQCAYRSTFSVNSQVRMGKNQSLHLVLSRICVFMMQPLSECCEMWQCSTA